jgi:hypothetical protein
MAGGESAPFLQPGPQALDLVWSAIGGAVEMLRLLVGRVGANQRPGAGLHHQRKPGRGGAGGLAHEAPDGAGQGGQQQVGRGVRFQGFALDQGKAERAPLRVTDGASLVP